jgi:hypothetical protein
VLGSSRVQCRGPQPGSSIMPCAHTFNCLSLLVMLLGLYSAGSHSRALRQPQLPGHRRNEQQRAASRCLSGSGHHCQGEAHLWKGVTAAGEGDTPYMTIELNPTLYA